MRLLVLKLLLENRGSRGAYELAEALKLRGFHSVRPPTVYRALEFLMDWTGIVSRIVAMAGNPAQLRCSLHRLPNA